MNKNPQESGDHPKQNQHTPSEEEAQIQKIKAAQALFNHRLKQAAINGEAFVEIPPELYEDEPEHGD